MATEVLGAPIKRKEDPRFITGEGNYVDDIKLPGMVYAAVLRSPYAHANIRSIDTSRARTMPGVVGVYTGADFMDWLRDLPSQKGGAVAVVAVTAFPHYFPAVKTRGFAAYLVKPVDLSDLCWTVASILGRGSRATSAPAP